MRGAFALVMAHPASVLLMLAVLGGYYAGSRLQAFRSAPRIEQSTPRNQTLVISHSGAGLPGAAGAEVTYDVVGEGPGGERFELLDVHNHVSIVDVKQGRWRVKVHARRDDGLAIGIGVARVMVGIQRLDVAVGALRGDPQECIVLLEGADGVVTYVYDPESLRCAWLYPGRYDTTF